MIRLPKETELKYEALIRYFESKLFGNYFYTPYCKFKIVDVYVERSPNFSLTITVYAVPTFTISDFEDTYTIKSTVIKVLQHIIEDYFQYNRYVTVLIDIVGG